jgi:hypothetical protein
VVTHRQAAEKMELRDYFQTASGPVWISAELIPLGKRDFKVARDQSKEKALETIRRLARPFPRGFKFHREEANER